ncbi:hypothetical protein RLO149_c043120 [Roseobacter litoralis Och 149]|uniref:Uncharacterized protein n=1 Tax=Roseobacter litoralis (strain ATCC 49566 / DSM 6996 / JCM 21268 / NBRC 15278 / OCh 149) TaxID=391595 RepID=F7ZI72_ROSLO|nr:hypothetical protein RLO149_c043120 [Roseobacter litoralis Och 149]
MGFALGDGWPVKFPVRSSNGTVIDGCNAVFHMIVRQLSISAADLFCGGFNCKRWTGMAGHFGYLGFSVCLRTKID